MAQQVKAVTVKSEDLGWVPGTHGRELMPAHNLLASTDAPEHTLPPTNKISECKEYKIYFY